jgi:hypothetical protein
MLVGKLAVLLSCLGVLLGLFMFADRVMVLRLMMVMRGSMMVSSCVVMVLTRWMFRCLCHLDALFYALSCDNVTAIAEPSRQRLFGFCGSSVPNPCSHRPRL